MVEVSEKNNSAVPSNYNQSPDYQNDDTESAVNTLSSKESKLDHYDSDVQLTDNEFRRLKWKSHAFFVFCGIAFGVQTLDISVISAGSVMGLRSDLHMHGDMYSWVTISYFIAYVVANIPFGILMLEKIGARYNGLALAAAGVIVACSGASQNYAGYISTRALLGVAVSVCEPTIAVSMYQWTHSPYHYGWSLLWMTWAGIAQILLQALGYGLYIHAVNHNYTIAGWRIFFIIIGLATFVYSLFFYFVVPNSPQDAKFLTPKEKAYMRRKSLNNENRPFHRRSIEYRQIKEVFTSGILHSALIFLSILANGLNGSAVNTFSNIWLKSFIHEAHPHLNSIDSNKESLLYGMISPAVKVVLTLLIAVMSLNGVFRNWRCVYIISSMVIHLIATCLLVFGPTPHARYGGLFLYNATVEVAHMGLFSVVASNMGGLTKKITVNGLILIAQGIGGCIGPKIFQSVEGQAHGRQAAMAFLSAFSLFCLCLLFSSFYIENKIRDKKNEKRPPGVDPQTLTDKEDPEFRYSM